MTDHLTDDEREALKEQVSLGGMPGPDGNQFWWTSDVLLFDAVDRLLAARLAAQRDGIANAIKGAYLGPDFGRAYDGTGSPDAHLHHAYDEGLEDAARIAREYEQKENDQ